MKIIGGTFGLGGSAYFSSDGYLVVDGAKRVVYKPSEVLSVVATQDIERRFSFFSMLIGLVVTAFLTFFFSVFGFFLGVLITVFGSRYKTVDNIVTVDFEGNQVVLNSTPKQVKKLVQFKDG